MKICVIMKSLIVSGIVTLLVLVTVADSKVIHGELTTHKEGIFEYDVEYPKEYAPQNILLYFDARSQWPAVYKQNKTCREKHSVLIDDYNQVINLTEPRRDYHATSASGCRLIERNGTQYYRCVHHRTFQSYRERWWFVALDNCQSTKGLKINYTITMTNSQSNPWFRHFSADQFYIVHTDILMAGLFYILLIATCFEAYSLYTRHLLHKTYKLYILSLTSECIGLLFLCVYYILYAQHGEAWIGLKTIGKSFEAVSNLAFILLMLLLSKGYTVTRAKLKKRIVLKFSTFMVFSATLYAILIFHEQYAFDPGEVLYVYESFDGYLIVTLRLLAWSWFSYAIIFTLLHYPQKASFFAKFFLFYSLWFISAPIVTIICSVFVPKYMREKVTNAVELSIAFWAHFVFFYLTRPSRANKNFPFHVRTTQIAIMEKSGPTIDQSNVEHFSHYSYAPSRSSPLNIFTLSQAMGGQAPTGRFVENFNFATSGQQYGSSTSAMTSTTSLSEQTPPGSGGEHKSQNKNNLPLAEE